MARPNDVLSPEEVQRRIEDLRRLRSERLDRAGQAEKLGDLIADVMNQLEVIYVAVYGEGTKPQATMPDGFYPASPTSRE